MPEEDIPESLEGRDEAIVTTFEHLISTSTAHGSTESRLGKRVESVLSCMRDTTRRRRIFYTSKGYVGVGFYTVKPGDLVVIFPGALVPFILRKQGDGYKVIGESYVNELMSGEIFTRGEYRVQNIRLV